jgi:hypothetical protein
MRRYTKLLPVCLFILGAGFPAPTAAAAKKERAAQPDAAMMEMMKYGAPGEAHKVLEPLVGSWTIAFRSRMNPKDKFEESKGTSQNQWIYGGRFLKSEFKGDWAGQVIEGTDFLGHDNMRNEYQLMSLNGMATGIFQAAGAYDPASRTLKFGGHFACPMTGEKEKWFRSEWKVLNSDQNVFTTYFRGPDGQEFQAMEAAYTRVK